MKILQLLFIISFTINCLFVINIFNKKRYPASLKIGNTIDPVVSMVCRQVVGYDNVQFGDGPAIAGGLIYKREACESCIGGISNQYYIREYEWGWENERLWYKPIRDIKIDAYSCIAEKDLTYPYWDDQLRGAEIGKKFYR